jgi:hypothetical protein
MISKIKNTVWGIAFSALCTATMAAEEGESTSQWAAESELCCELDCCSPWSWEASAGAVFGTVHQGLGTLTLSKIKASAESSSFNPALETFGSWDWTVGFSLKLEAQHCNQWGVGAGFVFIPLEASAKTLFPATDEEAYCIFLSTSQSALQICFSPVSVVSVDHIKYEIYGFRTALAAEQCFGNGLSFRALLGATIGGAKATEENRLDNPLSSSEIFFSESHKTHMGMLGLDGELGGRFSRYCCSVPAYIDVSLFAHGWSPMSDLRSGNWVPRTQEVIHYEDIIIWGFQASVGASF